MSDVEQLLRETYASHREDIPLSVGRSIDASPRNDQSYRSSPVRSGRRATLLPFAAALLVLIPIAIGFGVSRHNDGKPVTTNQPKGYELSGFVITYVPDGYTSRDGARYLGPGLLSNAYINFSQGELLGGQFTPAIAVSVTRIASGGSFTRDSSTRDGTPFADVNGHPAYLQTQRLDLAYSGNLSWNVEPSVSVRVTVQGTDEEATNEVMLKVARGIRELDRPIGPLLGSTELPAKVRSTISASQEALAAGINNPTEGDVLGEESSVSSTTLTMALVRGTKGRCVAIYNAPLNRGQASPSNPVSVRCGAEPEDPVTAYRSTSRIIAGTISGHVPVETVSVRISAPGLVTREVAAYKGGERNGGLSYYVSAWSYDTAARVEALDRNGNVIAATTSPGLPTDVRLEALEPKITFHYGPVGRSGETALTEIADCPGAQLRFFDQSSIAQSGLGIEVPLVAGVPDSWAGPFKITTTTPRGAAAWKVTCSNGKSATKNYTVG